MSEPTEEYNLLVSDKLNRPDCFEANLISEYLRSGSIEQVFKIHHYDLPVSFATYHRILNKYGVVKSAGPNSKLSESLHVLSLLNNYKLPLERIYHRVAPKTLQVSSNTLHRILHNIRLGVTRRCGAALIISQESQPGMYLLGQDISLSNPLLGNRGDFSLPMSHTRMQDSSRTSIIRVLQQEVFANQTINGCFPAEIIPQTPKPALYINIADIKVAVYKLIIPDNLNKFSSFRLKDHKFYSPKELQKIKLRPGVGEIIKKMEEFRFYPKTEEIITINSDLNLALSAVREG